MKLVRKSLILTVLFLLAAGMGFSGPKKEATAGADPVRAGRLIVNMDGGRVADPTLWNPYAVGTRIDAGMHQCLWESLFYFNLETGDLMPWLAEGYEYNGDFTEITLQLRKGVEWSDGVPFGADDVVFTIQMLIDNAPTLTESAPMEEWVKSVRKTGDHTVQIVLNKPNSRFVSSYLIVEIWGSLRVVPKHVFENVDPITFTNYDPEKGWPLGTGPYRIAKATQDEFLYERRDDWWGAKTGFHDLPKVKQVVWITGTEETRASLLASGKMDYPGYMTKGTFEVAKIKNPNVGVWHEDLPYAWMEPVPLYLGVNTAIEPWNDREIRWAINHALDREEMAAIAWEGISTPVRSIFAETAPLLKFVADNEDLFEKYPIMEYNPEKTAEILERKGYTKGKNGFWVSPSGKRLELSVDSAAPWPEQKKMGMVIAEQLQRAGIDAKVRVMEWASLSEKFWTGNADMWPHWIVRGVAEPYPFLEFFHGKWVKPIGERLSNNDARWENREYDAIVDAMSTLTPDDEKYWQLAGDALEIWMRELPVIPTTSQPALLPFDTTYWTNWPTAKNAYIQPYFQCATMLPLILELEPAQ